MSDRPIQARIASEGGGEVVPIVWVIGCQGSGKGTQCLKIVEKYGFAHFDPQALVDKEIEKQKAAGKKFEAIRSEGREVPLEEIVPILEAVIMGQRNGIKGIIIDGYPRDISQATLLQKRVGSPDLIISLEVGQQVFESRNHDTPIHASCLMTYQNNCEPIFEQYSEKITVIDGDRDPHEVFKDIERDMDMMLKGRKSVRTSSR